jgi:monofunctional biosynthetic peptidoglycan transglycosylase
VIRVTKKHLALAAAAAAACLFASVGWCFVFPDVSALKDHNPATTSFMQYRQRQWRDQGRTLTLRQNWVAFDRISLYLVKAVIISEDAKFWQHDGFDFEAIQNALEKDIKAGRYRLGASTITQQLAKNLFLSPRKNPIRKIKEAILTWRLEHALSKKRLIELYLNVVEWGDGTFGAEAAARRYFAKPAAELGAKEASRLAAVLPNPIRFNAASDARYVVSRSGLIYKMMVDQGIVVEAYDQVIASPPDTVARVSDTSASDSSSARALTRDSTAADSLAPPAAPIVDSAKPVLDSSAQPSP